MQAERPVQTIDQGWQAVRLLVLHSLLHTGSITMPAHATCRLPLPFHLTWGRNLDLGRVDAVGGGVEGQQLGGVGGGGAEAGDRGGLCALLGRFARDGILLAGGCHRSAWLCVVVVSEWVDLRQ